MPARLEVPGETRRAQARAAFQAIIGDVYSKIAREVGMSGRLKECWKDGTLSKECLAMKDLKKEFGARARGVWD